jgi:rod shape-determining protein MreB
MLSALKPVVYVQLSAERLTLKNLKSGQALAEVPEVALSAPPKPKILAVGGQARSAAAAQGGAALANPFAHPRSLVSDFTLAEQVLKALLRRVQGRSLLAVSPFVLMHPLGTPAGGFTQVELRALHEMALGAGASEVVVWTGRPLTDQEILSRQLPPGEGASG